MTETISFRSRVPKRELQKRFGNVSEALNALLEQALSGNRKPRDWAEVLNEPKPVLNDQEYSRCLQPE